MYNQVQKTMGGGQDKNGNYCEGIADHEMVEITTWICLRLEHG